MATAYKVLGQSKPGAATLTDIYTVPGSTSAVVSHIVACNQSATPTAFRVSVAIAGAADTPAQYIAFDQPIGPNETVLIGLGMGLATTDKVRVYNTLATVSFNLFGCEIS